MMFTSNNVGCIKWIRELLRNCKEDERLFLLRVDPLWEKIPRDRMFYWMYTP